MAQPSYEGGILRVASAGKTAEAIRLTSTEEAAAKTLDQTSPAVIGLLGYLNNIWEQNRKHKEDISGVQDQMIKNLQSRNNEYSDEKRAEIIAAGMPDVYMGLTNVKCSHAEAWLMDIFSSSERTWGLQPTPVPDPVQDVAKIALQLAATQLKQHFDGGGAPLTPQQFREMLTGLKPAAEEATTLEVQRRTQKMENKILDQMVEGDWDGAFEDFICDLVTLKAGIVKGPIARKHKRLEYVQDPKTGEVTRDVKAVNRPEYWRVSPLDIYPSPTAEDVNDGSLVERVYFSRRDLLELKKEPGYDGKAIDGVLEDFSSSRTPVRSMESTTESDREDLEDKDTGSIQFKEDLDGLEFWCSVQGKDLVSYGVDKIPGLKDKIIDPLAEYAVNAIKVGEKLIYVDTNDNPLGTRPYSKTGWRKIPGSFWYKGVPELMEDLQRIINAAIRSMCYNMSMSSGPQVDVDVDRLVPGETISNAFPGKVWQTQNRGNNSAPAIRFFSPASNSAELFAIYENFAKLADDYTSIPAYSYGSDRVAGAGRTSSGLSMLMTSAAKGIKRVILAIDKDIYKSVVRRQFDWNMQYEDDSELKGDIDVITTGAVAVMVKEQMSERRMQFLNSTANPMDLKLTGMEGRANVLREAASALEMENTQVVKSPDDVRKLSDSEEAAQAQAQKAEAEQAQAEAQLRLQGIQLDNQTKQLQLQIEQVKMQMEQQKLLLEAKKVELAGRKMKIDAAKVQVDMADKQAKTAISAQDSAVKNVSEGLKQLESLTGGGENGNLSDEEMSQMEGGAEKKPKVKKPAKKKGVKRGKV